VVDRSYIAVTSVRDEEDFIEDCLRAVLHQSIPPDVYVVVDDGSTDGTPLIVKRFKVEYLRIDVPRHPTRGVNLAYALNKGVERATELCPGWRFLLKVDGDTVIPPRYAEYLIERMEEMPQLGICGGQPQGWSIRPRRVTDGARLYRRECWEGIGGLDLINAFDLHAVLKARRLGWETRTFPIRYLERRWSAKMGMRRWINAGFARKSLGFPLWHTALAALRNLNFGRPPIIGPLAMLLSHPLGTWPKAPGLDAEWMRRFAAEELRESLRGILS